MKKIKKDNFYREGSLTDRYSRNKFNDNLFNISNSDSTYNTLKIDTNNRLKDIKKE